MQVCTMNVFHGLKNIALAFAFIICVVGTRQLQVRRCPPYWNHFTGFCYRYFPYPLVWVDAEFFCQNLSGASQLFWSGNSHLVSIYSQEEQDFVYGQFLQYHTFSTRSEEHLEGEFPDGLWIGLTDRKIETLWTFTDGKKADYKNWHWSEPNGIYTEEDAALLWFDPNPDLAGKWYDVAMNDTMYLYPFICKMPASCCLL